MKLLKLFTNKRAHAILSNRLQRCLRCLRRQTLLCCHSFTVSCRRVKCEKINSHATKCRSAGRQTANSSVAASAPTRSCMQAASLAEACASSDTKASAAPPNPCNQTHASITQTECQSHPHELYNKQMMSLAVREKDMRLPTYSCHQARFSAA